VLDGTERLLFLVSGIRLGSVTDSDGLFFFVRTVSGNPSHTRLLPVYSP